MHIQGTAAVVTGGASGLGEATARALAAKGAKVAVFDRDVERGEKVASEIGGIFCEVNVTSDESVDAGRNRRVPTLLERRGVRFPPSARQCLRPGPGGRGRGAADRPWLNPMACGRASG